MEILILGGSGYVGRHLAQHLSEAGLRARTASRHSGAPGETRPLQHLPPPHPSGHRRHQGHHLALDTRDLGALTAALRRCDAVVNAVNGSPQAIAEGARVLALAVRAVSGARPAGRLPVVHLSSMAVYGEREGRVTEADWPAGGTGAPPDLETAPSYRLTATVTPSPAGTAYARAKREAEAHLGALAAQGWPVAMLRIGCVWGPGSPQWVNRIADLLAAGRLGDLGEDGDGWTQGVHVDDVCEAVRRLLCAVGGEGSSGTFPEIGGSAGGGIATRASRPAPRIYNLAAPDSPRWNRYLHDLALAIGATPLRRVPGWRLRLEAWVAGPPLYLAARLRQRLQAAGLARGHSCRADDPWQLPEPLTPPLLRLMRRQLQMDCSAIERDLAMPWTAYSRSVQQGAAAWRPAAASLSARARNSGLPST